MEFTINGRFLTQRITGVQRYARELLQALDKLLADKPEAKVTVFSPRGLNTPPIWRNIKLHQVGYLQGHAWEQLELPLYCRDRVLFCPANLAPVISLLGAQSVVVTVHDLSYRYFPDAYSRLFRLWYGTIIPLALRRSKAVITVSEAERAAIVALYPDAEARLRAIQNGGLPADFAVSPAKVEAGVRDSILYVGSLSRRKNFPGVFEAAIRLSRARKFRFVFVGGVTGGISGTALKIPSDVRDFITFAGQVDDPAILVSYYKSAACFVFPSFYEASPLPPIEAMACGCPVVASDIASLKERCGDAAVYCDPHSVDSITAALERVMGDGALRATLRAAGLQCAAKFTWEDCARRTLDVIRDTAEARGWSAGPAGRRSESAS